MAEFVLDASVAFSWCFPGDPTEDTPYSRRILTRLATDDEAQKQGMDTPQHFRGSGFANTLNESEVQQSRFLRATRAHVPHSYATLQNGAPSKRARA